MKIPSSWSTAEVEVADAYGDTLSSLKMNSKPIINTLTELAYDYSKEYPHIIVHSIEEHIREVGPDLKLTILYLMDSIVKNHQDPYKHLFSENVVSSFVHVFRHSNEKGRAALFKLRNTWTEFFSPGTLLELDREVNKLDPAWPIVKPKPVVCSAPTKIHINPAVFGRQSTGRMSEAEILAAEMKRKELELMELKKKQLEQELMAMKKSLEEQQQQHMVFQPTGISETELPAQDSKSKILVNSKKVRDPRVRENLPKNIADMLEKKEDSSASGQEKIRSKTPEKSKIQQSLMISDSKKGKQSASPRHHESPTSTSEEKQEVKKTPATEVEEKKSSPAKVSSSSSKSKERSRHGSDSKSRKRERQGSDRDKSSRKHDSDSTKSPVRKKEKEGGESPAVETEFSKHDASSSPSPPPKPTSQQKPSPKRHSSSKTRKSEQRKFRIPKKNNKSRTPSPTFSEEGPHMEFNNGQPMAKKRKIPGKKSEKKMKMSLNEELFGDDVAMPHPARAFGWAKFKEVNPDEYRTPMKPAVGQFLEDGQPLGQEAVREPFRKGQPPFGRHRLPDPRMPQHIGRMPFPGPAGFGPPPRPNMPGAGGIGRMTGPLDGMGFGDMGQFFQQLGSTDPEIVLNKVIPDIMNQAREKLNVGRIDRAQFTNVMKQVMQLKEQAMMIQADRMHGAHHHRDGPRPVRMGEPPMAPGPHMPQHPPRQRFQPIMAKPEAAGSFNRDLPLASPEELEAIAADPVTVIDIDMQPRPVRFYGETATILMGPSDVRQLSFSVEGLDPTRRVIIDDRITLRLPINIQTYVPFTVNGMEHGIKIGAPTRELWIDGMWYQCYFNESVKVKLGNTFHSFYLEGPPPNVKIGDVPLKNLCAGSVQLIIDGNINETSTLYLDAKPQRVDIAGKPHVFRFVEGLHTLLINGHPFQTRFGGTPMVVYVNQLKHFLRLTSLPEGVHTERSRRPVKPATPARGSVSPPHPQQETGPRSPPSLMTENSMDASSSGNFENKAFDRLLSLMPSPATPRNEKNSSFSSKYSSSPSFEGVLGAKDKPADSTPSGSDAPAVDIHNLWSQLVGAGLVTGAGNSSAIPGLDVAPSATPVKENNEPQLKEEKKKSEAKEELKTPEADVSKPVEPTVEEIQPIVLKSHHPTLKRRQAAVVNSLYNTSSLQCKNCGLRYSPTDMIAYSQHLDWHFRINRREKENARKAQSRPWYFEAQDWLNSDEIDDEKKAFDEDEERAKSEEKEEMSVVPVDSGKEGKICPVCNEEFEEFFSEDIQMEKDDGRHWYYRNAVTSDGRNYHPQCLQDKTLNESFDMSTMSEEVQPQNVSTSEPEASNEVIEEELNIKTETSEDIPEEMDQTCSKPSSPVLVKTEQEDDTLEPVIEASETQPEVKPEIDEKVVESGIENVSETLKVEQMDVKSNDQQEEVSVKKEPEETEVTDEKSEMETEETKTEPEADKSLDGTAVSDTAPDFVIPAKQNSIRINITTQLESVKSSDRRESTVSNASDSEPVENSEFDPDSIIQPPKIENRELKPKLKGKKLVDVPTRVKGTDTSGLCSIM